MKFRAAALAWVRGLPDRFQEELEGMALGSGLPLQKLAEWAYVEEWQESHCSGFICVLKGQAWVARNNDTFVPGMWGYATIREVAGRIPALSFGMEADVFTPTGINAEKLWLHYHHLQIPKGCESDSRRLPCYAWLVEAMETCRTVSDVQELLSRLPRSGGMLLFAVDGKTNEFGVFECTGLTHRRRDTCKEWLVAANHCCALELPPPEEGHLPGTLNRFSRMEELVARLAPKPARLPDDLISVLADAGVERRGEDFCTVCANVACPATGEIWFTFGGHPAASKGNWWHIQWPW